MNYARVWAKRVAEPNDPKVKINGSVSVSDPAYKGKLEFMKWGADGGEVVEIRYLPHSNTLDKQYQDNVQKLRINEERDVYIALEQGLNDFDSATQPLLVQMLKVHGYNQSSESKDPSLIDWDYVEFSPSTRAKSREAAIVARNEATAIVINAKGKTADLKVLGTLFGENARQQDEVLYENLLDKAEADPQRFLETITDFKNVLYLTVTDALQADIIRVANGTVSIRENNRDVELVKDLEGEGNNQIADLIQKAYQPQVYEAFLKMRTALEGYKQSLKN
jgi:hypothetical protein